MEEHFDKNIKFMGNQTKRNEALNFVDGVLKEKGRFDEQNDFTSGLKDMAASFMVHIIDDDDSFVVKLEALEDHKKYLEFVIDKESKTVYRPMNEGNPLSAEDENIDFLDEV